MRADNIIKLNPDKSVLKYRSGEEIKLSEAQFVSLSRAFFDEIEKKYLQDSRHYCLLIIFIPVLDRR